MDSCGFKRKGPYESVLRDSALVLYRSAIIKINSRYINEAMKNLSHGIMRWKLLDAFIASNHVAAKLLPALKIAVYLDELVLNDYVRDSLDNKIDVMNRAGFARDITWKQLLAELHNSCDRIVKDMLQLYTMYHLEYITFPCAIFDLIGSTYNAAVLTNPFAGDQIATTSGLYEQYQQAKSKRTATFEVPLTTLLTAKTKGFRGCKCSNCEIYNRRIATPARSRKVPT